VGPCGSIATVEAPQKKTLGKVVGGCGCLLLLAMTGWLGFLLYVGIEGRGNDEEVSLILGAISCVCTIPILILTGGGLYFGLRKTPPAS